MSPDPRLSELLAHWEVALSGAQPTSVEDLCRDCPELVEPLRREIQNLQATRQLTRSGEGAKPASGPADASLQTVAAEGAADAARGRPGIAGYELLGVLGHGGMGVVYKARQTALGRVVALKMVRGGGHACEADLARFRAEAQAIARLQHPNLVQVYEVGEYQGEPWFSMEYVAGGSLHDQIDGKPQPPRQAAELARTLALALHAVHRQGVVHRDLKPANVLLTADGTPKVMDFGLAKSLDGEAGPTVTGRVLGTPSYMAPEQARGHGWLIGPATDVYALGAVLYELLTGRPPFQGESAWDTIQQVTSQEPVPPRRLQPKVPRDLETACLKCLEKDPKKRYASAEALADDLGRFLAGEPTKARPVGRLERAAKWARRRPAAAALLAVSALALLALTGGGLAYHVRLERALGEARAHAEESRRRLVQLYVANGARSLDEGDWFGSLVWFAEALRRDEGRPGRERLHRARLAGTLAQCPRLVEVWSHHGPVKCAAFSPDGRRVLTGSDDHTARVWGLATGAAVGPPLGHKGPVVCVAFSPDGRSALTAGADGTARVWPLEDGAAATPPLEHGGAPVARAAFSPHGRRVVTACQDGVARVWEAADGKLLREITHGMPLNHAAFSPDGRRVVTAGNDHTARVWDAATGAAALPPLRHDRAVLWAAFSPDGRRLVTAGSDHTARLWDAATGKALLPPLRHQADVLQARFSPDGRRVVTAGDDHLGVVWGAEGRARLPALRHGSGLNLAAFSHDGRHVLTASDDNTARVWDAETGAAATPWLRHNGGVEWAAFSPDGRRVVTASNDNTARVWELPPERRPAPTAERAALAGLGTPGRWPSPDGRRVAVPEGSHGVRVRDAATDEPVGPPLRHGSVITHVAFSPDGTRVVTTSDDNTARVWDAEAGRLLTPPLHHRGTVARAAFSPDGGEVVTAGLDDAVRVWDARTGEPLMPPLKFAGQPVAVAFAPDGGGVSVTTAAGEVWTWGLPHDDRPADDLLLLARLLSGSRIDPERGLLPLSPAELEAAWNEARSRGLVGGAR
jgi:eukaryotic-like serine/threonine-protein kinase